LLGRREGEFVEINKSTKERPFVTYFKNTAIAYGLLIKAIVICFVFLVVGGAMAPLTFIGMMLGMFPNIITAAYSWLITIPLLCLLPLHAMYAFVLIISKKSPDYTKGIYGAVEWVERKKLYDPTYNKR
jgi:Na+-driven multidrug efflux pump